MHAEIFGGLTTTSVDSQENVTVFGAAAKFKPLDKLQLKGEFLSRSDFQATSSDGYDYYLQAGYALTPVVEPVIKLESLNVSDNSKDQTNITVGANLYLNKDNPKQSKIMVNYVIADIDGKGGLQILYQVAY